MEFHPFLVCLRSKRSGKPLIGVVRFYQSLLKLEDRPDHLLYRYVGN